MIWKDEGLWCALDVNQCGGTTRPARPRDIGDCYRAALPEDQKAIREAMGLIEPGIRSERALESERIRSTEIANDMLRARIRELEVMMLKMRSGMQQVLDENWRKL